MEISNFQSKKDSAVSHIVGVMLTLMITVMLAGIVGVFAMSLMGGPVDVSYVQAAVAFDEDNNITIIITKCDDNLLADDLELSLTYTTPNTTCRQIIDFPEDVVFCGTMISAEVNLTSTNGINLDEYYTNKTIYNLKKKKNKDLNVDYSYETILLLLINNSEVNGSSFIQAGYHAGLVSSGSTITVNIKHIPTGKIIYKKDVLFVDVNQND